MVFLFIFALPVLAFIAAVVLALVGLSKGGLRAAIASAWFVGVGAAVGMVVATDVGALDWLAGGPTRATRIWFLLIALAAGPLVPLVCRLVLRRVPTLRHVGIGNAAVAVLVLLGSIPDTIDQRSWVATGRSTDDATYRYDRRHNVLVVDLRRDWHYNSEVRFRVACDDARGDRLAAGDRRTVMHLDGTSLELDATGYCKLLDPHQGFRENDAANGALMHRADV